MKLGLLAGAVLFVVGTGLVIYVGSDLPDPNKLADRQVAQSTKIFDRTGEHMLYEVYQSKKRTLVPLDQIAPLAVKATIAVEDKDFYSHKGIQPLSILRAAMNNLLGRRTGAGGASTLTQQLIKNTIIGDEHSLLRKLREAVLAIQLEKKYSKDEILKLYLNEIPYGSTNYGIESAAQSYFHKPAKDLTLGEGATLAGMIQAPSRYLNDVNSLRNRRDLILRLMQAQGYITTEEMKVAQNEAPRVYRTAGIFAAPHFVLYVKQLLADQFGESVIDTGGLKVITSLDYDKQILAEKVVKENGDKFASSSNANNAALIAMDPKTAQILALVGSRDFFNEAIDGQFNVAILGRRQPGSSFKPFVYTAAFEKGFTPETVLYDVKTNFDARAGMSYTPKNYDGKERGLVTMRTSLQGSLNIPAVKTMYLVGSGPTIDFAKRFGYTTFTGDYGLTLVLGGAEVSPLEHTNAYATLADDGRYHTPVSILSVTDSAGNSLYKWQPDAGTEAVKPELAALISSVLSDNEARVYVFGRNSTLTLGDRPVAAKTGTTQDNKDAWTMGYVPSLATGVWVGNTKPSPMKGGGSTLAGRIWNDFMKGALKTVPPEQFPAALPNDATKPVLRGNDGGILLPIDVLTGRIATSSTPENLITMKSFLPPHDILFYVNKDDPRGEVPTNPDSDPQYTAWENGLQDWLVRQEAAGKVITFADPPTEYDNDNNLIAPELLPVLQVYAPLPGQVLTSRLIHVSIKTSAPNGIAQVMYVFDGITVTTTTQYPFEVDWYAERALAGPHTLKIVAIDTKNVSVSQEIPFLFDLPIEPPTIDWLEQSPLTIRGEDFPRVINITPYRWESMRDVKVFLRTDNTEKLIYTFTQGQDQLFNKQLGFSWKHSPGVGSYVLRAVMTDTQEAVVERFLTVEVK
jgi:1A family penicillin-binding protein